MRHILVFENNNCIDYIHVKGKLLKPNEVIKQLKLFNYVQLNEQDLVDLCGKNYINKLHFVEKDNNKKLFFNEEKYLESKQDDEIS